MKKNKLSARISKIAFGIIRILGIIIGVIWGIISLVIPILFFSDQKKDPTVFLHFFTFALLFSICLLFPYRKIKRRRTGLIFLVVFVTITLDFLFSTPISLLLVHVITFGNVYLFYKHYRTLKEG